MADLGGDAKGGAVEHAATIVTSNFDSSEWGPAFPSNRLPSLSSIGCGITLIDSLKIQE